MLGNSLTHSNPQRQERCPVSSIACAFSVGASVRLVIFVHEVFVVL
jgi:hypothetical protein